MCIDGMILSLLQSTEHKTESTYAFEMSLTCQASTHNVLFGELSHSCTYKNRYIHTQKTTQSLHNDCSLHIYKPVTHNHRNCLMQEKVALYLVTFRKYTTESSSTGENEFFLGNFFKSSNGKKRCRSQPQALSAPITSVPSDPLITTFSYHNHTTRIVRIPGYNFGLRKHL